MVLRLTIKKGIGGILSKSQKILYNRNADPRA